MLDPVPMIVIRAALALLLGISVAQKLRAPEVFRHAVAGYRLLPASLVGPVAGLLIVLELVLALGCALGARGAFVGVTALLVSYSAAIGINLARGRRDIDCGCGGPYEERPLSHWLILRNGVLASIALIGTLPVEPRELSWMDGVTILATLLASATLYAAFEVLAAQAPRLEALRHA